MFLIALEIVIDPPDSTASYTVDISTAVDEVAYWWIFITVTNLKYNLKYVFHFVENIENGDCSSAYLREKPIRQHVCTEQARTHIAYLNFVFVNIGARFEWNSFNSNWLLNVYLFWYFGVFVCRQSTTWPHII